MTKTPYTNIEKVSAYLLEDIEESFQSNVERWILGISRAMDDMANRQLVADEYESDEEYEMRYFDVEVSGYLSIDDCVDIESVEVKSGSEWITFTPDQFIIYPALAPHRKIIYGFPVGFQNVRIRAKWGYMEEITKDLEWAATVLVAGVCIANQVIAGRNPGPMIKEKTGNYEIQYASGADSAGKAGSFKDLEEAKAIIANYRKILI